MVTTYKKLLLLIGDRTSGVCWRSSCTRALAVKYQNWHRSPL